MAQVQSMRSRLVAVLGPTNTGKTHFAVERMLAHRSGIMGFPLRLLAREIYDRIVATRGRSAARLVTGEEKLGPDTAPYTIATVEAMPADLEADFLAVDEIQLCADLERGHVFTDRLLHSRGLEETMFLGSETMRPIIRHLLPGIEIITRPRFSILRHAGHSKLHRLPRRSAIVSFTAADVYTLAELIRRQKGGAAVVMGALSPRTRNAQVELYQSGEVDHLVATDAIGMGLNMDVTHVAFASLEKFDGREHRRLRVPEMAQISGRAGRHMADGTFGTTNGSAPLEDKEIEAIENHLFAPVKHLRWRNDDLDYSSLEALLASLDAPAPDPCLVKVRDALDDRSLALLSQRPEIRSAAASPERIRLLWQICQIPDFRKTLTDAHLHLLSTVFLHVGQRGGKLPNDWVGSMIARLERTDGDIDALVARIAHIRTWTYLSHRRDWLHDPVHWQGRAREVEDRLSDALHERLTQRFVDRRTASLMRSLREVGVMPATIEDKGDVLVDGHHVGTLKGLHFHLASSDAESERRVLQAAARRIAGPELARRARDLAQAGQGAFALNESDRVTWNGAEVARVVPDKVPFRPRIRLIADDELDRHSAAAAATRLQDWLDRWLSSRLEGLNALGEASCSPELGGAGRAIAFRLVEGLGSTSAIECASHIAGLGAEDRMALTRLGVRFGRHWVYLQKTLRPAAIGARAFLLRIEGYDALVTPRPGGTVLRGAMLAADPMLVAALGFAPCDGFALRQDVYERLAAKIREQARESEEFTLSTALAAEGGLSRDEFAGLVGYLGYNHTMKENGRLICSVSTRTPSSRRRVRRDHPAGVRSPFAALAVLKS